MNILIAEDDPVNLLLVKGILAPLGEELTTAKNGAEALALIKERSFDLFLFDVMMPDTDGLALTRVCRVDPRHRDIPVLLLTALSNKNDLLLGFEAGATDYIVKPFHASEVLYRVKAQLKLRGLQLTMEDAVNRLNLQALQVEQNQKELAEKEKALSQANVLLAEANKILADQASRDSLTNLFNRRKGWDYMKYEEEKSRRTKKSIGVALMDLDKFKLINDLFGHDVGDQVLKSASDCLISTLRATDILIRWGGEEFLAVMPDTDEEGVASVAEKIRKSVEQHPWKLADDRTVTVSIGTTLKTPQEGWEAVVDRADKALYQAKAEGRNRVVHH